jgi:dTDP-4-amino-4,6-dideoxygalactose transaminase
LSGLPGVALAQQPAAALSVYHQYTLQVDERDAVQRRLAAADVQTMVYYPVPLHLQTVHAALGYARGAFPVAEAAAESVISLPIYPELEAAAQQHVIGALAASLVAHVA